MTEPHHPDERFDNPIERLRLLGEDDDAVSAYLDSLDVQSPREREMLAELARTRPLADAAAFPEAHRNAVEALESLRRHGYRGWAGGRRFGPLRNGVRFLVEFVARYLVVSYFGDVATQMRNLYWLREMQSPPLTPERRMLRVARIDAEGLVTIAKRGGLGVPTFVVGGVLAPIGLSISRATTGALQSTPQAIVVGVTGAAVVLIAAHVILSGTALASRRIRVATREPLEELWRAIGWARRPPRDESRTFAVVAITLTSLAWLVIPIAVGIALTR